MCQSNVLVLPKRVSSIRDRKNESGGSLPSVLRSLESYDDLQKTLSSACENLSPKEQTVVLKQQRSWERVIGIFEFFKAEENYVPNVIHYNVVLRALGKARKWNQLRFSWIEMVTAGVSPTENTFAMLVDVYGRAGLVKEALLWIKLMIHRGLFPGEVTLSTVIRVLKDVRDTDRADRFYKNWCSGKVSLDDLELDSMLDFGNGSTSAAGSFKQFVSTELLRTGKVGLADREGSIKKPRLPNTYSALIDLYGKAGRLNDAVDVFSEMLQSGVATDTVTFNTMIFTCGSHGRLSEAEALLGRMEKTGVFPDTKTYNILLSLYASEGNIEAALRCYRKIRQEGLYPDTVTYRAVFHVLCQRNMVQEAEAVLKEMDKYGKHIDEQSLPVLMKMYVNEGLLDQAKTLFDKFHMNRELSSKSCAAVMDAYAEKGLWMEAEDVFYRNIGVEGRKNDVIEYNVMIKAYGNAKVYDKALSLFKSMSHHGTWPDESTYNSIIQMLSGGDLVDEARELLSEMQASGFKPRLITFSSLVACYARLGQLYDAVDIYKEMARVGVTPNEFVYGSLIYGFAEIGQSEEAVRYFDIMEERGLSANKMVLTSLIKAYSKLGFLDSAKRMYEKMKDLEGGPDIIASNYMISVYGNFGIASEAKFLFDSLRENGSANVITYATMMHVFQGNGMKDEAIDVAEEMKLSGLVKDIASYNSVMACYAWNRKLYACGELLREMIAQNISPSPKTYEVLLTLLKNRGFPTEGAIQLESAYEQGKPYSKEAVMATVFSVLGLHSFALKFAEAFMKGRVSQNSFAYNAAIYAYYSMGQIGKALNIFMKMQDQGLEADQVTYIYLAGCYGKACMTEGVKQIHSQLMSGSVEPSKSLFKAIIAAYRNVNRRDLAECTYQEMKLAFQEEEEE